MSKMSKVIIVTGGSEGLGKEIARKFAPNNKVIILARNQQDLEKTADEIGCDFLVCDVREHSQIKEVTNQILEKYNRIDVLVNNAGLWMTGELTSNDPGEIKNLLEVNTLGTILFSREVTPVMKKQKSGHIINIVSDAGLSPKAERTVYRASKYAITGFTKSLELELSQYGISVTGIYPSKIKTKIFEKTGIDFDLSDALEPAEVARVIEYILSTELPVSIPHVEIKALPKFNG